jgi:hypothetical protein
MYPFVTLHTSKWSSFSCHSVENIAQLALTLLHAYLKHFAAGREMQKLCFNSNQIGFPIPHPIQSIFLKKFECNIQNSLLVYTYYIDWKIKYKKSLRKVAYMKPEYKIWKMQNELIMCASLCRWFWPSQLLCPMGSATALSWLVSGWTSPQQQVLCVIIHQTDHVLLPWG